MNELVIDIETYRTTDPVLLAHIEQEQWERRPPGRASKDISKAQIDAWDTDEGRAERVAQEVADTSKNVLMAELVCCGLYQGVDEVSVVGPNPEGLVLQQLAEVLRDCTNEETVWIGHNLHFDLSVLLNRWRRHRIAPPPSFPVYSDRRWRGRIFDTMLRTPCPNGLGYVKLDLACKVYGLPSAKSVMWEGVAMDGSRVGTAFEALKYELLREYCAADVLATWHLYQVQTAEGAHGRIGRDDELRGAIEAIWESNLDDTAKRLATYSLLEKNGRIPK